MRFWGYEVIEIQKFYGYKVVLDAKFGTVKPYNRKNIITAHLLLLCGSRLVSLVQARDNLIGYIISLVGIQYVVTGLAQYQGIFLILIIYGEIVLYAVAKCLVKLIRLGLELITQPLLQLPQVGILLLQSCLNGLGLLLCIFIVLDILLELSHGALQ